MFHDWKRLSARYLPALTLLSVLLFSNCSPQKRLAKTQEQDQLQLRRESDQQTATDTATTTKSRRGLTWWQKALCFVGLLSLIYIFYRFFKNK